MKDERKETVTTLVQALVDAATVCDEAKAAGELWLANVGTEREDEAIKALLLELEEDIVLIDDLIGFAGSAAGQDVFGAELAAKIHSHAEEIKAAGATHCDCPACAAAIAILAHQDELV